jgi:hypothetical protein
MANDTQTTLRVTDGLGNPQNIQTGEDVGSNLAYQMIPRVNGGMVTQSNPLPAAIGQVGPAAPIQNVTTASASMSGLALPGRLQVCYPAYQLANGTTAQVGQVLINWAGGNALTAPTAALLPGQTSDWVWIGGTVSPTVCNPQGNAQLLVQQ